jgi:N-acetylneuraminic acid mutarotase
MPGTERWGHTSAVVPNSAGQLILYVIGGSSASTVQPSGPTRGALATVQAYDFATNTWSTKAPMPLALYRTNGAGVIAGKIYASGGRETGDKRYQNTLFVYDPAQNTWSRKRDMPSETWGGVTGVIGDKLYVLTCETEADCDRFERLALYRYDPATDQWTLLSVTPRPLGEPLGGVINGKLYVTGGPVGALVVYDPATNEWTQKASLPGGRERGAAAVLAGRLYILGGGERQPDGTTIMVRKTTVYIPSKDVWRNKAEMPTQRFDFAAARVVVNGQARIAAIGGARPGNHVQYTP